MDRQPARLDFAMIGHVDRWEKLTQLLRQLRDPNLPAVPESELRQIIPWIPPRPVSRFKFQSQYSGKQAHGAYIETFITPDQLAGRSFKMIVEKVRSAAIAAGREGAQITALGGFTSIALESQNISLEGLPTVLTTGNTLTAAFIVKGLEAGAHQMGRDLSRSTVLIVGATGDVGSGCARYLSGKAGRLLLAARNPARLDILSAELEQSPAGIEISTNLRSFLPRADIVIAAASLPEPELSLSSFKADALICDAGYPRNITDAASAPSSRRLFFGGMGRVQGEFLSEPDLRLTYYDFPLPNIVHGCLLEAGLLALEGRIEPFSQGRGNIDCERIEEIWGLAQKHGFEPAPFFDANGLWPPGDTNPPREYDVFASESE